MTYPTVALTVDLAELGLPVVAGAIVRTVFDKAETYGGETITGENKGTTNSSGQVVLNMFPNALTTATPAGLGTAGSVCNVRITLPGASAGSQERFKAVIPNQACDLNDIRIDTLQQVSQPATPFGAVRYDAAQVLTSGQKAQAIVNLGLASQFQSHAWPNVTDSAFGADNTGVTDAAAAFTSAAVGASLVVIPSGTYRLNSTPTGDNVGWLSTGAVYNNAKYPPGSSNGNVYGNSPFVISMRATDPLNNQFTMVALMDLPDGTGDGVTTTEKAAFYARVRQYAQDPPGSTVNYGAVAAQFDAYVPNSNPLGRAWGIHSKAVIQAGGVGDGNVKPAEFQIFNEGSFVATPGSELHKLGLHLVASGSVASTAGIFISADSPAKWNHGIYTTTGDLALNFLTLNNTSVATNTFCVANDGRLGIGVTHMDDQPSGVKLYIKGAGDTRLRVQGSGTDKDVSLQLTDSDYGSWHVNNLNGQFNIAAGPTSTTAVVLTLDKDTYGAVFLGTVSTPGLKVKEGSNAKQGVTSAMSAGSVTVSNTSVTASSRIHLTRSTAGGTLGQISYTKSAGVGFTITSTSATETSAFDYLITEPA